MACFLSSRLSLSIHSHASYSNLLCPLLDARWRVQQNIKRSVSTTHTDLFGYGTVYMVKVKLSSLPIPRLVVVVNSYCNISLTPISPWNWLFAFGFLDALEGILMPIDSNRLNIDIGHGARSSLRNQQQEKRGKLPNLVSLKFLVGFFFHYDSNCTCTPTKKITTIPVYRSRILDNKNKRKKKLNNKN